MSKHLTHILENLPDRPGIYLFYDAKKELIYVGKATSLKSRVRSYFNPLLNPPPTRGRSGGGRPIEDMIHLVSDIQVKEVDSPLEAAILESIYIKKYQPKYNVLGRDNKSWNYIVITKEAYPRVETLRQHEFAQFKKKDLTKFIEIFGPYPGMNTKATMKILRRLFYISDCQAKRNKKQGTKNKRPCLYYQMGQCLGVCTGEISSREYKEKVIAPLVSFLRGNKKRVITTLQKRMKQAAKGSAFEEAGRLRDQVRRLDHIQDIAMINESFVHDEGFALYQTGRRSNHKGFRVEKIEGYDISNLGATNMVGSLVVFVNGKPDKSQYRKFNIKTVEGQSDVDSLKEIMTRRLHHAQTRSLKSACLPARQEVRSRKGIWPLPDVFLIDGGKPQVNAVKTILKEQDISIPVVGIAKGPLRKKNEFILGSSKHDLIRWVALHKQLLIAVRDEAHRFAITFQRQKRKLQY